MKPMVEADSRRRPRGRRGALAAPPARLESRERSPEAQGSGKSAKVLHQTKGGASPLPQMPRDRQGQSQRPLPPPQQPALGRDEFPVHTSPRVAPRAGSSQPGLPGAKARFWHSGEVLASRSTRWSSCTLQRRQETRGSKQQEKFAFCQLQAIRSSPPFFPPTAGPQSREAQGPTDKIEEDSPGTAGDSGFGHEDAR